jgi:ADP-heptose:LPS heptosyltransferase
MIISENHLKELISKESSLSLTNKLTNSKKDISHIIKSLIFSTISLLLCSSKKTSVNEPNPPLNIALIRNDAIGDYIVSTGAIRLIKNYFPECKIDILAGKKNIGIISKDPLVNQAILCESDSISSIAYKKLRAIGKEKKYNYVICLNNSKTTVNAIISCLIGKYSERVIPLFPMRKDIYGKVFTMQIDIDDPNLTWAERMTELINLTFSQLIPQNKITANLTGIRNFVPYIYINQLDYQNIYNFNHSNNLNYHINTNNILIPKDIEIAPLNGERYTIINISAGKDSNTWSSKNCIELLNKYYQLYPNNIVYLSSSPAEYVRAEDIVKSVNRVQCKLFKSGLNEFVAFLSGAELLISPDTGVTHISACAGINSIILYPTKFHLVYWRTHSDKRVMILSPDNISVNSIQTNDIIEAIKIINHQNVQL